MYEYSTPKVDQPSITHYFKPESVKQFGDRIAFGVRVPLPAGAEKDTPITQGTYEGATNVVDCTKLAGIMHQDGALLRSCWIRRTPAVRPVGSV
jgi:hypothetical protein